jgi:hypothetical protein
MAHAAAAGFALVPRLAGAVQSVELQVQNPKRNHFSAQARPDHINFYLRGPVLGLHEGLFDAAVSRFGPVPPNSLDEYRTHLRSVSDAEEMLDFLRARGAWPTHRHARRFVAETFRPITGEHLLNAARHLASGGSMRPFEPSTEYDLLFDRQRLPPKAVFGLAAAQALGFPVAPANFSAGEGTVAFGTLRSHGYPIVPKGSSDDAEGALVSDEDRAWAEGRPKLITHLRRERGAGLAAAKRDQFRARHGRLFCERCRMDPISAFGSELGEACIEVHHRETHVSKMSEGHVTRLEDLQCLCANCHRVTHREIKLTLEAGADRIRLLGRVAED